ncbi:hypothetical protein F5Y00DRAFT_265604 [Daldinia vernicosa]|uniref:uncharacterized protein n=1 Tax=Daldinia vernicosa TaxID=114800 RepID=UPI0020082CE5|nr:uncharacterized protein F5Y00DRAFT_265604 [Daldinia vernicosa]KAI0845348.1 hypothetical protein F5Y00DRAFT_265604 [Daldinia vernicosa]
MNPAGSTGLPQAQQEGVHKDIIIAVMGRTGCGKSQFISRLNAKDCGNEFEHIYGIRPSFVWDVERGFKGNRIVILDTPGYGDNVFEDVSVFGRIKGWRRRFHQGKPLFGLIYIQDINEAPPTGRHTVLGLIQSLRGSLRGSTGEGNLSNVIVLTTKWDGLHGNLPRGDAREAHLHETSDFWKAMVAEGATVMRHDDTVESAERVIQTLFNQHIVGVPFGREMIRIQQELNKLVEAKRGSDAAFEGKLSEISKEMKETQERLARLESQSQDHQNQFEE